MKRGNAYSHQYVYTNNMYETMRHAEEVTTSSIKYHFNGEDTTSDREIEDEMFQNSVDGGNGW